MSQVFIAHLGLYVRETMTTPKRAGKQPKPVWEVTGNVDGLEQILYDFGAARWPRNSKRFSFWEDPIEKLNAVQPYQRLGFEEQQERKQEIAERRADRLEERAAKHAEAGHSRLGAARQIGSMIPFGQPIMVGHHSERRHRRDIERIDNNYRKGFEHLDYSNHLSQRAELNREKAEGKFTILYVNNRIKETQATIRRLERNLGSANTDEYRTACELRLAQEKDKLDYWQEQWKELGGTAFSKETVNPGDWLYLGRYGLWFKVVKANTKTCEVQIYEGHRRGSKYDWPEFKKQIKAADWDESKAVRHNGLTGGYSITTQTDAQEA